MDKPDANINIPSSFRDPSGFLFQGGATLYRQVNIAYKKNYDLLMGSGLYETLVDDGLLIPHEETGIEGPVLDGAYKIIKPEPLPFVSYPYEWCFSQLKDAALATLEIQRRSLDLGMSLKDCSAYNMQFRRGRPALIDTLSFEEYRQGQPWVAYRQFCQHFLAPLALMSCRDIRLSQLLRVYIDGIPLDLASSLLPFGTRMAFPLLTHIHLHAKAQEHFCGRAVKNAQGRIGRLSFMGLVDSLESAVRRLKWDPKDTEWSDYYEDTNYSPEGLQHKRQVVSSFLSKSSPKTIWDLGANVGMFSRIAAGKGISVVSFDIDPAAVEKNYLKCIKESEGNILPLVLDLVNPSPAIGWDNMERMSLFERGPADMVFSLALVHHLAISNNLPFNKIADSFSRMCSSLIIEFVPKEDSQAQRLLASREDIFCGYNQQTFEREFGKYFAIQDSVEVKDSKRVLYLMVNKSSLR